MKTLAEFILFSVPGDKGPLHKQSILWASVSKFVEHMQSEVTTSMQEWYVNTAHLKNYTIHIFIAEVCRCKVTGHLAKR